MVWSGHENYQAKYILVSLPVCYHFAARVVSCPQTDQVEHLPRASPQILNAHHPPLAISSSATWVSYQCFILFPHLRSSWRQWRDDEAICQATTTMSYWGSVMYTIHDSSSATIPYLGWRHWRCRPLSSTTLSFEEQQPASKPYKTQRLATICNNPGVNKIQITMFDSHSNEFTVRLHSSAMFPRPAWSSQLITRRAAQIAVHN